jgi:PAS domain S-box-containing protein
VIEYMDKKKTYDVIWIKLIYVFILLIALVWLDELIDIPKLFFDVEATPVNWLESAIETFLIAIVGIFTISRLIPKQKKLDEKELLRGAKSIWLPVLMAFLGICIIIWLNEIIDLPHLLMKGKETPINWSEAAVETILVVIVGIFAVSILIRSITERARAQDLFFKSFNFSPIPAAITTFKEGKVIQANEVFFKMTGFRRDEIIGKSVLDLDIWVHPDQRVGIVRKLTETGSVRNVEVQIRDATGSIKTILYSTEIIEYLGDLHMLAMAIDITNRKTAEESLIMAEAKYRNMFIHSINGISAYKAVGDGEDFIFIDFNKSAEKIDHIKKQDVVGKSVLEIFPKVKEFGLFAVFQRVWKSGKSEHFPISHYKDDRVEGWRDNFVYKLPSGEIVAVYSDETFRKKTEDELHERERELVTLLGNLPGMAYRCRNDKDRTMEFVSEGCYELTGYVPSDFLGNKKVAYADLIHPDDRDMVWNTVQTGLREREHFQMTYRINTADGQEKWVSEQGIGVFSSEGNFIALEGFISDITSQKHAQSRLRRSEEKFSKAFHASPDLITISTLKEGIYIDVNEAFLKTTGYSLVEVIGKSSLDLKIFQRKEDRYEMVKTINENRGVRNQELILHTKDGRGLTMLWSAELFEFGGEKCILSISRDITENKCMEERLKYSENQLRELYKNQQDSREAERTRISREIHDDLGQELTGLKLELAYLARKLPADQTDLINKASLMSKHIDMSIDSVRRISMDLRPALLDQLGLVAAIEWQAEDFQKRTGILCKLTIDPDTTVKNKRLSTTIFRIFQETLTNITRHANATRVDVALHKIDGKVSLSVKDNGKGIAKERITNPRSFGLISMKERVSDLGGELNITGRKGKGTTVSVNIPLKRKSIH